MPFINPYARKKTVSGPLASKRTVPMKPAVVAKPSAQAAFTPQPKVASSSNQAKPFVVTNAKPDPQKRHAPAVRPLVALKLPSSTISGVNSLKAAPVAPRHHGVNNTPPTQKLSLKAKLKQELSDLKRQQRLHKEQLALHKQQKAQRKLLKKQQKEQAAKQAEEAAQLQVPAADTPREQPQAAVPAVDSSMNLLTPAASLPSRENCASVRNASNQVEVLVPTKTEAPKRHHSPTFFNSAQGHQCPIMQPSHHLPPIVYPGVPQSLPHVKMQQPSIHNVVASTHYIRENQGVPTTHAEAESSYGAQQQMIYSNPLVAQHFWAMQQHQHAQAMNYMMFPARNGNIAYHQPGHGAYPQRPGSYGNVPLPVVAPPPSCKASCPAVKPAPAKMNLLAANPCQPPSPYAETYEILQETFVVVKTENESFGVTLKVDMESTLVDPDSQPDGNTVRNQTAQESSGSGSVGDTAKNAAQTQSSNDTKLLQGGSISLDQKSLTVPTQQSSSASSIQGATNAVNGALVLKPPRRKRRRRVFFSVIAVLDPEVQNKRRLSMDASTNLLLQKDDIILTIAGKSTAALTFMEACALFKNCVAADSDGIIRCPVTVARRKPASVAKPFVTVVQRTQPVIVCSVGGASLLAKSRQGPLDQEESFALVSSFVKATLDERRLLGSPVSANLFLQIVATMPALSARGEFSNCKDAWNVIQRRQDYAMKQKAFLHWKGQWSKEFVGVQAVTSDPQKLESFCLTDAQRCSLRRLPRPPNKRCRCGSEDHQYVNNAYCPLYINLRALDSTEVDSTLDEAATAQRKKMLLSKLPSGLSVVEKAYKDRLVRMKINREAEEAEAEFVSKMEVIQLKRCKQAIFAPSLTAMVLSAVAELQSEFDEKELSPLNPTASLQQEDSVVGKSDDRQNEDSEDDDDDVPLTALGKRPRGESAKNTKRQRRDTPVRYLFLARLAQYVSHRWGHVFREPSNADYTWRWEVYHGQTTESSAAKWNINSNIRSAGSLSLENIRFAVDEKILAVLEAADHTPQKLDATTILAHVLSPTQTGICDELLALIRTNVINVDDRGIPFLAKDWWTRVDLLLLEDMHEKWSKAADPLGRYGVANVIRRYLKNKWVRTYFGWAFAHDEEDTVFDFEEFDQWRVAFEDKQQARSDGVDGVGVFR